MKKTLVLGASTKPDRYGNIATRRLKLYNHEVVPVGNRAGEIDGIEILLGKPAVEGIDTVTLYLNPKRQVEFYDYIIGLKPKRIIFNPGTENPALVKLAKENGIEPEIACTLVLLSVGQY
jgi:predicted CoA-binding protein